MKFNPKTKKFEPTEKDVRADIRKYLKMKGINFWWNLQGLGCYPGLPDLEGADRERGHFYIEVKSPKGELSEKQKEFKGMVEEEGELYIVAHSIEEFLEAWGE